MPSPHFRLPHPNPDNVLATIITGLEAIQTVNSAVFNVPYLSTILGAAIGIASTVQKVNGDKDRYIRLATRASELAEHIQEAVSQDPDAVDAILHGHLARIQLLLVEIQDDMNKQTKRRLVKRILRQSTIASKIDNYVDKMDSAWRAFDTACLIALQMKMNMLRLKTENQALYDDELQMRLFRWSDLKFLKVRGPYRVEGYEAGEEWEGQWDGRVVVVRTFKQEAQSSQDQLRSLVAKNANLHHPYIRQTLGYSHSALKQRFYVMEAGNPLAPVYQGKDTPSRVRLWLQHIVDYDSALRYVKDVHDTPFPDSGNAECHLPSAMINETGRLVIDAAECSHSGLTCFHYHLQRVFEEDANDRGDAYFRHSFYHSQPMDENVSTSDASRLLNKLNSEACTSMDVVPFIDSYSGIMLDAYAHFHEGSNVRCSDIGYMQQNPDLSETFKSLGRLLESQSLTSDHHGTNYDGWYVWPPQVITRTFVLEREHRAPHNSLRITRSTRPGAVAKFLWNHGEDIARTHGLSLADMIGISSVKYKAEIYFHDQSDLSEDGQCVRKDMPSEIYFHQLPLLATGEAHSPWGYWSLDPEPGPGPWPVFEIPGVELSCWTKSLCTRLSNFDAEMVVYLNSLVRQHGGQTKHKESRFEEIA